MGRAPLHALIWSREQSLYELYAQDQLQQRFRPAEEAVWLAWLGEATSFAFHGQSGSLNVYRERRPRGGTYWYAYHTNQGRTRKRYLGQTENLRLSRLEETARALLREQKPAEALNQGMPLLSGRLDPPRLPNVLVERERLLAMLDGALSTPLTLLCAPAGFGKTTLLSTWASQHKAHVAWLWLDELDNSPTRFWVALIAALRRCERCTPSLGETVVALLQSPQPPPLVTCLSTLLHELESREAHPAPLALILDDYQVISDSAIHESLSLFLEHLPAHLHLILASRVDPDLPLARLRARGQLTEIRADDLRFQEVEASQYLGRMLSPPLSEVEVYRLTMRTEGWIAGLHLAALAMHKRPDRAAFLQALTGSQRYLLDYVQEEILARLPTHVRDFLLHSAILSQMSASVCQAVSAAPTRASSQQMLLFLERANLFLVPLDEERRIFRLHEIFREALLACLHSTHPEMEPLLHRRAARFYEAQEQWAEAITHALQAADFSTAARLMEQTVEQFWVRGETAQISRWMLALPEVLVREHVRLLLTTALYLLNTIPQATREQRERCYQQVRQLMARVETVLPSQTDETSQPTTGAETGAVLPSEGREARAAEQALLQRRLRLLRLYIVASEALASGEHERLNAMRQEIEVLDQDEEVIWQIVPLVCSFVLHFRVRQEGAKLLPRLLEARRRASRKASRFADLKIRQWLALVVLEAGQLHLAYEESQAALDLIEQMAGYALLKGYFELVQIYVLYQWNRLEEARGLLHTALHDAATWQHLDVLGSAYIYLMQVQFARGEWSAAQQALHEVEQLVQRERYRPYLDWLHWWLAQGRLRLQEASDWAEGVVLPQEEWEDHLYGAFPVVIRGYFAKLRFREALSLLERWSEHLDRPDTAALTTLTYLAQLLVALHQAGQSEQVREIAARLFALTEPEGYLRVYLDEGEPMRQALLVSLTLHGLHPSTTAYVAKILAAFELEQQGASASPAATPPAEPASSPAPQAPAAAGVPGASLTRREQDVLRLLAKGASNQDIAQTLVISLDTVKKHVSNLLGKLGVTSRTQAIAQARTRSLL